jgi:hypothetical protein
MRAQSGPQRNQELKEIHMKVAVFCLRFISCLTLLFPGLAFSQAAPDESDKAAVAPVAYVYVSQSPGPGPNQVLGFAAAADGRLTPIEGSPFEAEVNFIAGNGKYLFGSTTDELYLNTYTIEPDGALRFAVANDISRLTGGSDIHGYTTYLTLDHSGATLYDLRWGVGDNAYYEAFGIKKANGVLTMPPGFTTGAGNNQNSPGAFTFSANNKYMYAVNSGWAGYNISMFDRASDGALLNPPVGTPLISNPVDKNGYRFDPIGISADPLNHVAVAFANEEGNDGPESGPNQLGVYTADAKGNLTTTSTYKNMPKVAVGDVNLKMAPSGEILAAFGSKGLQVFHFNGGEPITNDAILVQNVDFEQAYWDDNDHLFAVSQKTGKLYVFKVTPTSITHAPGSPYSIPGAQDVIVQPVM